MAPTAAPVAAAFGHLNFMGVSLTFVPIVHELLLVDALHVDDWVGVSSAAREQGAAANDETKIETAHDVTYCVGSYSHISITQRCRFR